MNGVGHAVALRVVGGARVHPGVSAGNLLQNKALVRDNDLLSHVVRELTAVVSPRDLVGGGAGFHPALEVHVVSLLDVGRVEAGAELQRRARYV